MSKTTEQKIAHLYTMVERLAQIAIYQADFPGMPIRADGIRKIVDECKQVAESQKGGDRPPVKLEAFKTPIPLLGSKWKHWKGAVVTVTGVGHHTETGEAVIHYTYDGNFWSRPQSMWSDEARPGVQRFTLLP